MSIQKVAVVTGASTGLGFQTATKLVREGFRVFGTARDLAGRNAAPKRALEAAGVTPIELDVTDQASVDHAAATILAQAAHVDVLVNNAGSGHMGATEAFTPESVERQFAVNLIGAVRVNRAFLPGMRERKSGLVVFISSVVGRVVVPFLGVYTASKWAVEAMAETLSYELRPFGVDVAIVEPGAYATNVFNAVVWPDDTARLASYGDVANTVDAIMQGFAAQAGDPAEVGEAIVELVRTPAGTRSLRTVVPSGSPVEAINAAVAPIQRSVLEAFGLGAFAQPELQPVG